MSDEFWLGLQPDVELWDAHHAPAAKPIERTRRVGRERRSGMEAGGDLDADYRKIRSRENNWMQDRAAMAAGNFTGLDGVNVEDMAVKESMGAIYDRTKEHLATSDVAVARLRRVLIDGVRRFAHGEAPPVGLAEPVAYQALHAEERMVPKSERWQDHSQLQKA